jgi:hypothetical protein
MIIAFILLSPSISSIFVLKLAVVALYEAYTTHIDNLVLPIFALGVFLI